MQLSREYNHVVNYMYADTYICIYIISIDYHHKVKGIIIIITFIQQ